MSIILRLPDVMSRVGLCKTEIYRRIREGTFPRQRRLSHKVAVWSSDEIDAWITATLASSTSTE